MDPQTSANIFDNDPYLCELTTTVKNTKRIKDGILYSFEKTIFYPQGGGQSSDKGWVNDIPVLDVQKENGAIWHLLAKEVSNIVHLRLNWDNRYTNMQQHTGQHILSAAFTNLYNIETVSVHLGADNTLIELSADSITDDQFKNAENLSNKIIRDHREVKSHLITKKELSNFNVRRDIKLLHEPIRLIEIEGVDCTGCGGTHVKSTSEVGIIKITGTENIRNRLRVKVKIGESAYAHYKLLNSIVQKTGKVLSCGIELIPDRIDSMIQENKDLNKRLNEISKKRLQEYAHKLEIKDNVGFFVLSDFTNDDIKILSSYWVGNNCAPCFIINENNNRINFIIRIPENLDINANEFVKDCADEMSLKGGGQPKLIQGVINQQTLDQVYLNKLQRKLIYFFGKHNGK